MPTPPEPGDVLYRPGRYLRDDRWLIAGKVWKEKKRLCALLPTVPYLTGAPSVRRGTDRRN